MFRKSKKVTRIIYDTIKSAKPNLDPNNEGISAAEISKALTKELGCNKNGTLTNYELMFSWFGDVSLVFKRMAQLEKDGLLTSSEYKTGISFVDKDPRVAKFFKPSVS